MDAIKFDSVVEGIEKLSARIDALLAIRTGVRADGEFLESDHPRAANGQFGSGGRKINVGHVYSTLAQHEDAGGNVAEDAMRIIRSQPELESEVRQSAYDLGYNIPKSGDQKRESNPNKEIPGGSDVSKKYSWVGGSQIEAAKQIQSALKLAEENGGAFGIRVLPITQNRFAVKGKKLNNSYKWNDGVATRKQLDGVSTQGLNGSSIDDVLDCLNRLGCLGSNGNDGYYDGKKIVLVRGSNSQCGEDHGEHVISDPEVIDVWNNPPEEGSLRGIIRPNHK